MQLAENDHQPVFYLDEYSYLEYWPHRLASAIRENSDREHDEDYAFQLLKKAMNTSLAAWDLDRSLHRSPLSATDIERMVESLQGAMIFSQHQNVDVSWFRESLESIAEERAMTIKSRFILYRVEATFVEEDESVEPMSYFEPECDEPELYLVDQLNGEAWHILPDLFPGYGWGYNALPQFSVSPLYVHAKHRGLRSQELQLA
ncbi:hypothetical protein NHN17_24105 [Photobacterium sp. ZSDE20]|uniref:Uncharacterized protein n=1 Tax=Photobacterium pectinilyticum TaxID=2906793 RepID=A0ABT1N8P8_9GAMM|nr:hypothetical protein [Photobacterium sp. ZSDE20]MCQ1061128.1 hypothetical protein [Photobacterium sp. ZSDE20]